MFCKNTGLYIHQMSDDLSFLVKNIWEAKETCKYGALRYYTVRLLHEIMDLPSESESNCFFTRSQIAILSVLFSEKRMEKAALLLTTTSMKVIEIANAIGYENQGKFANVFAKEYGASPLEFRRLSNNALKF